MTLALLREELHIRAAEAGSIIGPVTIIEGGDTIDCTVDGACVYAAWDVRDLASFTTVASLMLNMDAAVTKE